MRRMHFNCSGTNGEPQYFHLPYHRLLNFAVMWVSDKTCTSLNRAGRGPHEPVCDVSILTCLGSENKPWALWNWMGSWSWRLKCGAGGRGCNFWMPITCCSKKVTKANKPTKAVCTQKIVPFLLKKKMYTLAKSSISAEEGSGCKDQCFCMCAGRTAPGLGWQKDWCHQAVSCLLKILSRNF